MSRFSRARAALLAVTIAIAGWSSPQAFQAQQAGDRVDVLIAFRSAPGPADAALVRGLGGTIRYQYRIVPGMAASLPQAGVDALARNPRIASIDPDGEVFAIDAELDNAWGVKHIGAGDVHGSVTGAGVKVAVIDSGIDMDHPELSGNYSGGRDFVNSDDDPWDDNGHGTHVSGTIAAADNDSGVVGVAPQASLYAYKVLNASGSGNWSHIIAALDRAVDDQIHVTNNSYGSSGNPGGLVEAAFVNSAAEGILHIAAAGNTGNCGGKSDNVGYPARYDSVVAVAATTQSDARACFSSTGPDVEVAAPGASIVSTYPGGYASASGTSMASPHVAGLAALLFDAGVTTADEVRGILSGTAVDLGAAGRDPHFGWGRVDAVAAVAAASSGDPGPGPGPDPEPDPDPDPEPGTLSVSGITYSGSGGPQRDKHLQITVTVVDDANAPASGVSVGVQIFLEGVLYSTASGTTGTTGQVAFQITNAPAGCYSTTITSVSAASGTWDGESPANQHCK